MDESCSNVDDDDDDNDNNMSSSSSSSSSPSSSSSSYYAHPCCTGAAIVITIAISASIGAIGMSLFLWRRQLQQQQKRQRRQRKRRRRRRRRKRRGDDDDDDDGNRRDGSSRLGRLGRSDNDDDNTNIDDGRNSVNTSSGDGQRRLRQEREEDDFSAAVAPPIPSMRRSTTTTTTTTTTPPLSNRQHRSLLPGSPTSRSDAHSASAQSAPQRQDPCPSNSGGSSGGNSDGGHVDREDGVCSLKKVSGEILRRNSHGNGRAMAGPGRNPRDNYQQHQDGQYPQQHQQQQQQQHHQQQGDDKHRNWEFQPASIQPERRLSSSSQFNSFDVLAKVGRNANNSNDNDNGNSNDKLHGRRSLGSLTSNLSSSTKLRAGDGSNFDNSIMSLLRDSFTVRNDHDHDHHDDADNNGNDESNGNDKRNDHGNENNRQLSDDMRGFRDSVTSAGSCYDTTPNNSNNNNNNSAESMAPPPLRRHTSEPQPAPTTCRTTTTVDSYISETEVEFKGNSAFSNTYTSVSHDLPDSLHLLRRTRAVSALSNRLMAAPDEAKCLDEVARLLVLMFRVERVSFAMLTGKEHFLLQRVTAVGRKNVATEAEDRSSRSSESRRHRDGHRGGGDDRSSSQPSHADTDDTAVSSSASSSSDFDLVCLNSDRERPLLGTAAGACASTCREHYTPRTSLSPFDTHRVFHRNNVNTVLVSPILVNGNKCAGCIMLCRAEEDGFRKAERVLVGDMGLLLGANIYAKRLLKEAVESRKRSREMLHSFIPPKVFDKIECYWDANSDEFKSRKSSATSSISSGSANSRDSNGNAKTNPSSRSSNASKITRTNSWYVAQTAGWSDAEIGNAAKPASSSVEGIKEKIQLIKNINRSDKEVEDDSKVVILSSTPGGMANFAPTSHALYAENASDVCIVFTDIVGFSSIAMDISPRSVMDMLQDIFSRFDELCDVHGVLKLETIGDAYICCTNLMEDDDDDDEDGGVQDAAARALAMAKDMVIEATNVRIPGRKRGDDATTLGETLQIRVGIHVGDVTCGVLGQRLPKFTTCGTAVNMAARMEQTSQPGRIRVTKDFHDAVGNVEKGWSEEEVIPLKNMGSVKTYMLNPMRGQS